MQSNEEIISFLRRSIAKKGMLDLPSTGDSMYPFIKQGDICSFINCDSSQLKKGDIVLFWDLSGRLVAHRFHHREINKDETIYVFKGDTNLGLDQPVNQDRILGKLLLINRDKRKVYTQNLLAILWGKLILTVPVLSGILRSFLDRRG